MKAIILAAGIGSRLRPLTDEIPKCMIEVNGIKIIENQLNALKENNINDITVVTGYKSSLLEKFIKENYQNIQIIKNENYMETNNMYSMNLAKDFINNDEFIFMNADVFFDKEIIKELILNSEKNLIVCDNGNYLEESMKIVLKENKIIEINKKISQNKAYGTTIDIYKLSKEASKIFFEIINDYINIKNEQNLWTEVAVQDLINKILFKPMDINYKWVEIDNLDDLNQAISIFK